MQTAVPAYRWPWHRGSKPYKEFKNGRDTIETLGKYYIAVLSHGDFIHGPFETEGEALACVNSQCDCWKRYTELHSLRNMLEIQANKE